MIRRLKQVGVTIVTLAVIAVIAVTIITKSKPGWVGTTEKHELSRSTCVTPDAIQLHNKWWASKTPAPKDWKPGEYYPGKVKYESTTSATFTTSDGVKLKLHVSSDAETTC